MAQDFKALGAVFLDRHDDGVFDQLTVKVDCLIVGVHRYSLLALFARQHRLERLGHGYGLGEALFPVIYFDCDFCHFFVVLHRKTKAKEQTVRNPVLPLAFVSGRRGRDRTADIYHVKVALSH